MNFVRRTFFAIVATAVAACGGAIEAADGLAADGSALKAAEAHRAVRHGRKPHPAPTPVEAILRFDDATPSGDFASTSQFPIDTTSVVYIAVDWRNLTGGHSQRMDLLDPNGLLYGSATIAFATDSVASGTQLQAIPQTDGSYRLWSTFFVAGTPVEMYHLVGAWTVSVSLDGGPAVATSSFTLY
jgi:hypothetical protein